MYWIIFFILFKNSNPGRSWELKPFLVIFAENYMDCLVSGSNIEPFLRHLPKYHKPPDYMDGVIYHFQVANLFLRDDFHITSHQKPTLFSSRKAIPHEICWQNSESVFQEILKNDSRSFGFGLSVTQVGS